MDKEPFIIKSGKGHSVEIEQGSTHARRKTNVIAPQEDALEDRVAKEGAQEERKLADLNLSGEDVQASQSPGSASEQAESSLPRPAGQEEVLPEGVPLPADQAAVQIDDAVAAASNEGPVIALEARAEEDARAAKGDVESDRYLSGDESREAEREARGPKEEVLADRFASDHPDALPDEDLRGAGQPAQPLTNRQKVDSLQAQANRIQIEQAQAAPAELALERQADERAERPDAEADPELAAAPARPEEETPQVAVVATSEDLPPELAGNLGFAPAPPAEATDSGLMARVRALRSNMSVTDDRLSKLQSKPPILP